MENSTFQAQQIKILKIYFKNSLKFNEIQAFRAAVSKIAGPEHILFHHHTNEGYLYHYPMIQFKVVSGKPLVVCINEGTDEIIHFFTNKSMVINLNGRKMLLEVSAMRQHWLDLKLHKTPYNYTIKNWLPLNQENHRKFAGISSARQRIEFLEKILTGNILSFAKGVKWKVPKEIDVSILEFPVIRSGKVKDINMQVFNLSFSANVFLPASIGLGKMSSIGYGVVKVAK